MSEHTTHSKSGTAFHESVSPIKSVSVISTGTGEAHWEHIYGSRKSALWWIFFGRRWVTIPINVYVIEHSDGLVLFDTGQDRAVVNDSDYWPGGITGLFLRHLFRFHIGPDDTLTRQLEISGYSVADVRKAVISHLHCDHIGGIREIPQADLIVSNEAWEHMLGPEHPERHAVFRRDIDLPDAKWQRITFQPTDDPSIAPFTHAFDLMGDGSMILLPTPGHLPGSLSMLVRRNGAPPLLLISDLAYRTELIERGQFPGTGDIEELQASYAKVLALKEKIPDLIILATHDPGAAEALGKVIPTDIGAGSAKGNIAEDNPDDSSQ
ncbi:N-acyl homoserine lactonase family protein [Methanococcoides orientis]|uniref:N-acyl homoserine lactonase family protein n=1 Tax=Methanococcoides orientis TaxID=2822137 RepID=UPI001E405DAD|nr:N-acyl homoserine lactonase family protein [Methanococcoides orientis]UGV41379.1 N-acyl homoserine lactonase family protein [Methanococcoides orientis]